MQHLQGTSQVTQLISTSGSGNLTSKEPTLVLRVANFDPHRGQETATMFVVFVLWDFWGELRSIVALVTYQHLCEHCDCLWEYYYCSIIIWGTITILGSILIGVSITLVLLFVRVSLLLLFVRVFLFLRVSLFIIGLSIISYFYLWEYYYLWEYHYWVEYYDLCVSSILGAQWWAAEAASHKANRPSLSKLIVVQWNTRNTEIQKYRYTRNNEI